MTITTAPAADRPRPARNRHRLGPAFHALGLLAATAALAVIANGCGSSAAPHPTGQPATSKPVTDPTATPMPSGSAASGPQAYVDCMRSHGVANFPNPVDGHVTLTPASGVNPSSPTFEAAATACASLGPSGATSPGAPAGGSSDPSASTGSPSAATWRSFSDWLSRRAAAGQFSGTVLVADRGTLLLDAGYGLANRTTGARNAPQTKFCIASIGKLLTAAAIAQLVEQHKLSFHATLGRYLTGLPAAIADHVTIAELLTMTSGLDDVVLGRRNPPTTLAGMMKLIAKEHPAFKPGARFQYSNDGYILLGALLERAAGLQYTSYVREHILKPAGMTDTDLSQYTPARVPGMAHGYAQLGSSLHDVSAMPQIANPSGGAYSTVGDLLRFARALLDHKLLTPAMTATILTPRVNAPQPGGPSIDKYTYGFAYQAINGISFVGHNGGTPGYEGQIDIYPHTGYIVIILTNQDQTMIPAIQRSEAILTNP
ncbi:MAG: serine hydrolase [Solirubrobacteraceae bacterium]